MKTPNTKVPIFVECFIADIKLIFKANIFFVIENNPYALKLSQIVLVRAGWAVQENICFSPALAVQDFSFIGL